jgi:hypothetical protein
MHTVVAATDLSHVDRESGELPTDPPPRYPYYFTDDNALRRGGFFRFPFLLASPFIKFSQQRFTPNVRTRCTTRALVHACEYSLRLRVMR